MQRKRDGLLPIREAFSGPTDRRRRSRTPHPKRGTIFNHRADQVNQLIGASEADPDLGFMARTMALCSLPRSNPGNGLQYKRVNGPFHALHDRYGRQQAPLPAAERRAWGFLRHSKRLPL